MRARGPARARSAETDCHDRRRALAADACTVLSRWYGACIERRLHLFPFPLAEGFIMNRLQRRTFIAACAALAANAMLPAAHAAEPIRIGLVTALSGQSAQGGEA